MQSQEESPFAKGQSGIIANSLKQAPLPPYTLSKEGSQELREQISKELSLDEGDNRYHDLFECLCEYVASQNNAHIYFQRFFLYALKAGIQQVPSESNLKYCTASLLEKLKDNNYGEITLTKLGNQIESFVLKDPCFSTLSDYLGKFYGKHANYNRTASQLPKILFFPTSKALSKKFNFSIERVESNSQVLMADDINEETLAETYGMGKLLILRFPKSESSEPFEVVLGDNDVQKIVVNCLIPILFEVVNNYPNLRQVLKEDFAKQIGGKSADFYRAMESHQGPYNDDFITWLLNFERFIEQSNFIEYPDRFLSHEEKDKYLVRKLANFVPKILRLVSVYIHGIIKHQKKIEKQEQDKKEDQKLIVRHLCEGIKILKSKGKVPGVNESTYPLVLFDNIVRIKDISGQKILKDKYTEADILALLSLRDNKTAKIVELNIEGNNYYFHRWRLIDIFYSSLTSETARMQQTLIDNWAANPKTVPKFNNFYLQLSQTSPKFNALYTYLTGFLERYSDKELLELLFPSGTEAAVYKLHNSDLVKTQKYNSRTDSYDKTSPNKKLQEIKKLLYHNGRVLTRLPLQEALGLKYKEINLLARMKRKETKTKKEQWTFLDRVLNGMFAWLFGTEDKKKQAEAKLNTLKHAYSDSSNKANLKNIANKFHVPNKQIDLKSQLSILNDEWNKIVLSPEVHYPNWNTLLPLQKEKLKVEFKEIIKKRRVEDQKRVNNAVKKTYSKLDLRGVSDKSLTNMADKLAGTFKARNHYALRNYIKLYIVYINSK